MTPEIFKRTSSILGLSIVVLTSVAGFRVWQVQASDKGDKEVSPMSELMHKKLDASSEILEGLATEDSAMIAKGAETLRQLSKAEIWNVLTDSEYRAYTSDLRATVKKLSEAAEKGNFDSAALQWFDITKTCIECHQHVRSQRKLKN